ncbi:MAG: hypothetical protein GY813_09305 [Halieaceae bacterium]|nr:hypothetical protein [Halieaceae bacterium]
MKLSHLADELGVIKAQQAELAKQEKEIKEKLRAHLDQGRAVEGDFFRVTLSEIKRSSLDRKRVELMLSPDAVRDCMKVTHVSRFNINARK